MKDIENLIEIAQTIKLPSEVWRQQARTHLEKLTKPLGSLGRLEDFAAQMVSIRESEFHIRARKAVYVFAADHGIATEGVSAYPREVTHQMVLNFLHEGAAVNVLARHHGVELQVIDVGVDSDVIDMPGLLNRKVSRGTQNMLHEPAMSQEQMAKAIAVGIEVANTAFSSGKTMIAIGEMGIGNTTSASAITCALTGAAPTSATGHGTGVTPETYARKIAVVEALGHKHFARTKPDALDILRCVGGLEIAAIVGMCITAASHKLIIVIDGFISTAAAALAVAISPAVLGYMIAGHQSEEPGHKLLLDLLKLIPVLTLNMRLGEGTGAVLAMPILESAMALYCEMATFDQAGVSEAS